MIIPKNAKDVKGLRDFLSQQRTQACSTGAAYTGPLKQLFDELVTKIDAWLDKLPKEDVPGDWSLECQLDSLFALMAQMSASASLAALELSKLQNGEQFASAVTAEVNKRVTAGELFTKDAVAAQVKAQLQDNVSTGELVPKERLGQLCAEAELAGIAKGELKFKTALEAEKAEAKLFAERRQSLQQAALPLPDAEIERIILGGTEEEFQARITLFKSRQDDLAKESIQLASDAALANLWLDEKGYKGFERTVKSLPALKFHANPLATPAAPAAAPAKSASGAWAV